MSVFHSLLFENKKNWGSRGVRLRANYLGDKQVHLVMKDLAIKRFNYKKLSTRESGIMLVVIVWGSGGI